MKWNDLNADKALVLLTAITIGAVFIGVSNGANNTNKIHSNCIKTDMVVQNRWGAIMPVYKCMEVEE